MNKIAIFNENYVYLEVIISNMEYLNIANLYINKYTLKSMDKEDENVISFIASILLDRLNSFKEWYFYLYKITVESEFRYISFVYHLITNEQKYYEVIYNIYLKDKSIIEKHREILTPKVIKNLLEGNKIIS
jgi:hypothetical protein